MSPGGAVINISSKSSLYPTSFTVVYAAAKAGLNVLTDLAARRSIGRVVVDVRS